MRTGLVAAMASVLSASVLSGCAVLTAPAPLFASADQDQLFVLEEGLWAHRDVDCKADPARSSPTRKSCLDWARITREGDGAWRASPATPEDMGDAPMKFVVVPVTAAATGLRAPVYVGEGRTETDPGPNYAAIIPRGGATGAVRRLVLVSISCEAILRDGAIPDITIEEKDGRVTGCTATTKGAVREAARRAVLAEAPRIGEEELVWVRK